MTFSLPTITTRKRRLVKPENRKKALHSCDLCRKKKLACRRSSNNLESLDPCIRCTQLGIECKTTLKRRKRSLGPLDNVDLHYKCLFHLVKGLFPTVDVSSIDSLMELGESFNIVMPHDDGADPVELSNEEMPPCYELNDMQLVDPDGNKHFVGPLGAANLLEKCLSVLSNSLGTDIKTRFGKFKKNEMIISSQHDSINFNVDYLRFPLLKFNNRSVLEEYINIFFQQIHPSCYCFNETEFRGLFDQFWWLSVDDSAISGLTSCQVCSIYMVLIMGKTYNPREDYELDISVVMNIIKLCLPSIVLSPNLDGIKCLLLLSIYMDNNKRRDSGYCLIELASRQLVSLGLHRKTLAPPELVWWAVLNQEVNLSMKMGRLSCLKIEEITTDAPVLANPSHNWYIRQSIALTKIAYEITEGRKLIKDSGVVDQLCILSTTKTIMSANKWFKQLEPDPSLRSNPDIAKFKSILELSYHYYLICLTLPYLFYVAENLTTFPQLKYICLQGIRSSVEVASLITQKSQSDLINGSVSSDIFMVYHGCMGLAVGYILSEKLNLDITPAEIHENFMLIQAVLYSNEHKISGTSKKLCLIIVSLIDGIMEQRLNLDNITLDLDDFNYLDFTL